MERSESIAANLAALQRALQKNQKKKQVTLVAVSKTKPDADIMAAYRQGQRDFGENKVQDMAGKASRLPNDIRWHMIGHIQTNKIRDFVSFVHLVHGVDRIKVLDVLEKEAAKISRKVHVLLQMHIAQEATKFGFAPAELIDIGTEEFWSLYPHLCPVGLMGMASFTMDENQVRQEFRALSDMHAFLQPKLGPVAASRGAEWEILSMGMSGDWPIAVQEGSSLIRVGSSIFGPRLSP